MRDQFAIHASAGTAVYDGLLALFENDLEHQSATKLLDIKDHEYSALLPVPYWAWQSRQKEVLTLLHSQRKTRELEWSWPLVKDCIQLCTCIFGNGELEIAPQFLPIDRLPSFASAQRRIYMTATLADDSILVSHFGADPEEVQRPIRPKGGGDIGDRMILAPQEINPNFTLDEIKGLVTRIAETRNVVVIVPSKERAKFWGDVAQRTLDKANLETGVHQLKKGHIGLTVLVNKYDGIDLPGKACELLVIDGLPEVYGLSDRLTMMQLEGTKSQLVRQVQRIEQGMGRGVRSSDDHCVVLLIGGKMTERLHQSEADTMFSSATRAQIALGKRVAEQLRGQSLEKLEEIMGLCLDQNSDWVTAGRNAVVNAPAIEGGHVDANQVLLRAAFDAARLSRFDISTSKLQQAVNNTSSRPMKGYLKQQLAEYTNFTNPARAQELQLSAQEDNQQLLKPLAGTTFSRLNAPPSDQATSAVNNMARFQDGNGLVIWVNGLLEDLTWGEEGSTRFEEAVRILGLFLGFGSSRPEGQYGRGPDNLWALGNGQYLVIECKSGAVKAQRISKHDTNQLNGSITWFDAHYDKTCLPTPVLIHPKTEFEHAASPHADIRIMNGVGLERLRSAVRAYSVTLATESAFRDANKVQKFLQQHKLSAAQIVTLCTVSQAAK